MKFYPIRDSLAPGEWRTLGFKQSPLALPSVMGTRKIKAIATGEKRPPKAGEWFLSGAAYRARADMTDSRPIARIVWVEEIVQTVIIGEI